MPTLKEIKAASQAGATVEQTLEALTGYISMHPDDDVALTERGLLYWSLNKRSLAINDYLAAIRINPDSKAKQALESANAILDFFNKDLYNP